MSEHGRLESIYDVRSVSFVLAGGHEPCQDTLELARMFRTGVRVLTETEGLPDELMVEPSDVCFLCPAGGESLEAKSALCRAMRSAGYNGVLLLLTDDPARDGGTAGITSSGYDGHLPSSSLEANVEDAVNWAITNRKRRNKHVIQFDENPDSFYTIDARGRVYDINSGGAMPSRLTPKLIVTGGMHIMELGGLDSFDSVIQPLITLENIGGTFTHTVHEGDRVYQIKTRVHNVTTIGLVATVVKTDITETMYRRTMDILINSVTMLSQRDNYTAGHSSRVYYYGSSPK